MKCDGWFRINGILLVNGANTAVGPFSIVKIETGELQLRIMSVTGQSLSAASYGH